MVAVETCSRRVPPAGEGNVGALPLPDGSGPARVGLRLTGVARFGVRDVRIRAACDRGFFSSFGKCLPLHTCGVFGFGIV